MYHAWVIESMSIDALRAPFKQGGVAYDPNTRQIVLIRMLLVGILAVDVDRAQSLAATLQALNKLRVDAAGSLEGDVAEQYQRMGVPHMPATPRAA